MSCLLTGTEHTTETLIDLLGVDTQSSSPPGQQPLVSSLCLPADLLCDSAESVGASKPSAALSLLEEQLLSLGTP